MIAEDSFDPALILASGVQSNMDVRLHYSISLAHKSRAVFSWYLLWLFSTQQITTSALACLQVHVLG